MRAPDASGVTAGTPRTPSLDNNPPGLLAAGRGAATSAGNRPPPTGSESSPTGANTTAGSGNVSASTLSREIAGNINGPNAPAGERPANAEGGLGPQRGAERGQSQGEGTTEGVVSNRTNRTTPDGPVQSPQANPNAGNGTPPGNGQGGSAQNGQGANTGQGHQGSAQQGGTPQGGSSQPLSAQESARNIAAGNTGGTDRGPATQGTGTGNGVGQNGVGTPRGRDGVGNNQPGGTQAPGGQQGAQATDLARGAADKSGPPSWASAGSSGSSSSSTGLVGGLLNGVGGLVGSLIRTPQPLLAKLGNTISTATGGLTATFNTFAGAAVPGLPLPGGIVNLTNQLTTQLNALTGNKPALPNPGPSPALPGGSQITPNPALPATGAPSRPEALMTPGAGNQPTLPGVLAVAKAERAMTAHNALFAASQTANTPVRAGTANLLSMTGANQAANALAAGNAPRQIGAALTLAAGQQAALAAAQSLPAGQRTQLANTPGLVQGRNDAAAVAGNQPAAAKSAAGNPGAQAGAAAIAPAATQAAAASTLTALAAGVVSGELGVQSRETQTAIDREREQAQQADRNQNPMYVLAADIGRQTRPSKLEKTSILGRLLSVLSGGRGEGAMNAPDKPFANSRLKSTQTMMWVMATVAFGSVAAGMTVFWNSGALGVLTTPSTQALTLFALIGVAAGGAIAAWRAITSADAPAPEQSDAAPEAPSRTRVIGQDDRL